MTYYNTTNEKGEKLKEYGLQAATQDQLILEIFDICALNFKTFDFALSPSEIAGHNFFNNVPITSIRRSLTNLTKQGRLIKTSIKVTGQYGRKEHTWTTNNQYGLTPEESC